MAKSDRNPRGRKILLLTGAPRRKDLAWRDEDLVTKGQAQSGDTSLVSSDKVSLWRQLSMKPRDLPTGLIQPYYPLYFQGKHESHKGAEVQIADCNLPMEGPIDDDVNAELDEARNIHSATVSFISGGDDTTLDESFSDPFIAPRPLLDHVKVTSLVDLPSIEYVKAPPKTPITFHLLIIILAISTQKMQTGRGATKTEVDLMVLTVADETSCPFEISIWLDLPDATGGPQPNTMLRRTATSLRRFDVVLVRNVALRSFRNRIEASSMRRTTIIDLLYRDDIATGSHISPYYSVESKRSVERTKDPIFDKVLRILDWRDNFLQPLSNHQGRSCDVQLGDSKTMGYGFEGGIQLPADTQ